MRVKVIINPASGQPEPILNVLNAVFSPAGIEWDVAITHDAGDGVVAAREAADQGFDLVGVYGGDGTVSEVASALAQGGPPMLLLPGGTGNALAEDLGLPPKLVDAAALAIEGNHEIKRIDLGRAGEHWFVLRLTMGFEVELVNAATRETKDRYGWLAYVLRGFQALSDPPMAKYSMVIDGQSIVSEGMAAMIANSAATGVMGTKFADDTDVSDGALDVFVVDSASLGGLLGSAADAAQGREARMLTRWRGKEIHVDASPAQAVLADGEDAGWTPVDVTVVPGAIGVLVPKATDGQGAG